MKKSCTLVKSRYFCERVSLLQIIEASTVINCSVSDRHLDRLDLIKISRLTLSCKEVIIENLAYDGRSYNLRNNNVCF